MKGYAERLKKNIKMDGKLLVFVVLTFIFTKLFNQMADNWLTQFKNQGNTSIFTYNYSFGLSGLVLIIPAAAVSLGITILLVKMRDRFFPSLTMRKSLTTTATISLKVIKIAAKVSFFFLKWMTYLIMAVVNSFSNSIGGSGGGGSAPRPSFGGGGGPSRKDLKDEAQWQANRKQKEADYAWHQAKKQGQYNINTHHFDKRVHEAANLQRDANKAAKRARNL